MNRLTAEFAAQKSVDEVVTRFSAAKAKPVRNWSESLRRGSKTRLAELVAAMNITSEPANHRRGTTLVVDVSCRTAKASRQPRAGEDALDAVLCGRLNARHF